MLPDQRASKDTSSADSAIFVKELERQWDYGQAALVVENVVPNNKMDVRQFEQRLLAVAVVANASDLGPRDHLQAKTVLDEATVAAAHQQGDPDPDEVLTVPGLAQGDFRAGQDSRDDFDTEDLAWSENSILPCLTTPSDDARGRPAPRSVLVTRDEVR